MLDMIVSSDTITHMKSKPPYVITQEILQYTAKIAHELGMLEGAKLVPFSVELRRGNKIKTIQSSLAIEGNTLSIEQITAILDGTPVLGSKLDILEVENALKVYDDLKSFDAQSVMHLKKAHKLLMQALIPDNGKWREKGVGVFKGKAVSHMAPPAKRVPQLITELFSYLKQDKKTPWLIKACVFHYELEFIHPFSDGNGRMGRLWQQLLLMRENSIFEFLSIEGLIKENQKVYYQVLEQCDQSGDSTAFIEFSLEIILMALREYTAHALSSINSPASRLEHAKHKLGKNWFSRKQYIEVLKDISTATASRDLDLGVKENVLEKQGVRNQVRYRFK